MLDYILFSFFYFILILFRIRVEYDVTCHSNGHTITWSQWNMVECSRIMMSYNMLNVC